MTKDFTTRDLEDVHKYISREEIKAMHLELKAMPKALVKAWQAKLKRKLAKLKRNVKPNGYLLSNDGNRVIIATGFTRKSSNVKTGSMIQIWILSNRMDPVDAVNAGKDTLICGQCPLRRNAQGKRSCYVNVGQAPLGIWRAWQRGAYPMLPSTDLFKGHKVRFGAYGDPVFIPFVLAKEITEKCAGHTGYSHQWRNPLFAAWKSIVMASVETELGAVEAQAQGWRTFRVIASGEVNRENEITCPNTTKGVQCADCRLCSGASKQAKSITISVHGTGKSNFNNN